MGRPAALFRLLQTPQPLPAGHDEAVGEELAGYPLHQGGQAAGGHRHPAAVPQGPPGHGLRPEGKGKAAHRASVLGVPGHVHELGADPPRAHRRHPDAPGGRLPPEGPAVPEQEGLGGGVDVEAGQGLEGGGGTDLQHPPASPHMGQDGGGEGHGGLAVQIHHVRRLLEGHVGVGAELAEAGGVDEHPHVRPLPLQQGAEGLHALHFGQIQGDGAHGGAQLRRQGLHPPLPAGHPPDLVQAAQLIQAADEGRPQAGGRPGYQCDIHANASLPRCFLYCTPKRAAHASPPERRTGSPDPLRTPCILFHGPVFRRPELMITSHPK